MFSDNGFRARFLRQDGHGTDRENAMKAAIKLTAQMPNLVAPGTEFATERFTAPDSSLSIAENFLYMLRGEKPSRRSRMFDVRLILHADHELNASTFTTRVVVGNSRRHLQRSYSRNSRTCRPFARRCKYQRDQIARNRRSSIRSKHGSIKS